MNNIKYGVAIAAPTSQDAVDQIIDAEQRGVRSVWGTVGLAGGADQLTTFAVAGSHTSSIIMGTCIVQSWPVHPIAFAKQIQSIESVAPGRFQFGIGTAWQPAMETTYGVNWRTPLTHLREYVTVLKGLLHNGEIDFQGTHVTGKASISGIYKTPIMASALRTKAFNMCGEISDGAISWMCTPNYLVNVAMPAMAAGAEKANRVAPPLICHVPVVLTSDKEVAYAAARKRLAFYRTTPHYGSMMQQAGFDISENYPDELLDELVVYGNQDEIKEKLDSIILLGINEVLVQPILYSENKDVELKNIFDLVGEISN
ncbi:MAG: LLM class flavin-dependent oxidoreductase [Dehalococcoidia bacterium]|jgi:F420-dependent oxidoreductase-like protein|nr:LLM class flavin-dependent oxidoreductase [Dehalococcoidia bacterium]